MKLAGFPANEQDRLRALRDLQILDTAFDAAFHDLTRVAAHILETPIALVSLVDSDRQWFKARYGLDVPQLARDISFCGHVVERDDALVVRDTYTDARFTDNPLVTGSPHIRFYAGMPLRSPDGYVLGTLCAIDRVPREPSGDQLEMLRLLAAQVALLLEKRRLRLQVVAENTVHRETASKLASTFAVMSEGVVVQQAGGAIVACNDAAARILGLTNDQLCGRSSIDPSWRCVREDGSPFPGDEHPAMVALRTGERQQNVVMGVHRPDGTLGWISINSMPSRHDGTTVTEVVTTFHDITPLKLAAERLIQQERLVTTGTLVAGVGHEINNPLAFVIGNLEFALSELTAIATASPSVRLREVMGMLSEARVGADRIRSIVRGLRALSREDVALQPVDLRPVVETSLSMALHELRRKTRVAVHVEGVPHVVGDESRLTQVLVNLLVNAAQAFTEADPDRNLVTIRGTILSPTRLRLTVADNGPGVRPDIQARIFDAFFTTKPVGEGTGLGLAVSRGIVTALGGELTFEAPERGGAAFHLDLEIAPAPEPVQHVAEPAADVSGGRILLLDDDESVLATMRRVLAREHEVTCIADAREAADRLLDGVSDWDVIFCDLMMPHITGEELYAMVRSVRPELAERFVFVTGGATSSSGATFLSQVANAVIEKPFSLASLATLARQVVTRRTAERTAATA